MDTQTNYQFLFSQAQKEISPPKEENLVAEASKMEQENAQAQINQIGNESYIPKTNADGVGAQLSPRSFSLQSLLNPENPLKLEIPRQLYFLFLLAFSSR